MRAAIYNRCSTEEENQKSALMIQAAESLEVVQKKGWELIWQYVEAQSGTSTRKRLEYQKMITHIEEGRYDVIVIKSIDRLARNAKDWYLFLDCIARNHVKLYLYLEQKFYLPEDALLTGIKAILAEQFSKELSQKMKSAHRRRQEKGEGFNITREMFGFDKVARDRYVPNEKEAAFFRLACSYALEGMGYRRISNLLYEAGARSRKGERIGPAQWRKMLLSERACGTVILHREEYDLETGEKRKVPREQWIVLENALPALITRQEHDRVLKALSGRSRKKQVPVYHGKYPLSGKLVCGQCGSVFYRLKGEKSIRWKCARAVNEGRDRGEGTGCSSPILSQELLFSLLGKTLTEERWLEKQREVFLKDLCMVLKMGEDRGQKEDREKEKERQRLIRRKREKLLEKLLAGVVEDEDYRQMMERLNREEKAQKGVLADIKEENRPYTDSRAHFLKLQEQIEEKHLWEEAVARALLQEIRQIRVQEDGRLDIQFAAYREPGVYYGRTETGGGEILSLFYPVRPERKNRSGSARGSGNDHAQDGGHEGG